MPVTLEEIRVEGSPSIESALIIVRVQKLIRLCAGGGISVDPGRPVLRSTDHIADVAQLLQGGMPFFEESLPLAVGRLLRRGLNEA